LAGPRSPPQPRSLFLQPSVAQHPARPPQPTSAHLPLAQLAREQQRSPTCAPPLSPAACRPCSRVGAPPPPENHPPRRFLRPCPSFSLSISRTQALPPSLPHVRVPVPVYERSARRRGQPARASSCCAVARRHLARPRSARPHRARCDCAAAARRQARAAAAMFAYQSFVELPAVTIFVELPSKVRFVPTSMFALADAVSSLDLSVREPVARPACAAPARPARLAPHPCGVDVPAWPVRPQRSSSLAILVLCRELVRPSAVVED
jgi:hypothetical protein